VLLLPFANAKPIFLSSGWCAARRPSCFTRIAYLADFRDPAELMRSGVIGSAL